ncbi:16649_t:CDS:1, partial [Racocetra persica]
SDNSGNWVKYLRKELKDTNSITTPSKKTIGIIKDILTADVYNIDKKEYEGEFLKWGLEVDESVKLTVIEYNLRKKQWNPDDKKKSLDILPSFYPNGKNFILLCEVLENDDFITITRIGVIIWSYKPDFKLGDVKNIKMHYYWNCWNDHLEEFKFKKIKFEDIFEKRASGRILPAS